MAAEYSRRLPLLTIGVPTLIALASAAVLLAALPTLPAQVTVHWSVTGVRDKTAPPALALLALPASIGFGLLVWSVLRRPANVRGATAPRILTAAAVLFATVVSGGVTSTLLVAARSDGAFPWLLLVGAFVLGAILGALAALRAAGAAPRATARVRRRRTAAARRLGARRLGRPGGPVGRPHRRAPGGLRPDRRPRARAGRVRVAGAAGAAGARPRAAAASSGWRVRLDERGAVVRGALPPMVLRVPLGELAAARVTTVAPVGDFGGWGAASPSRRHGDRHPGRRGARARAHRRAPAARHRGRRRRGGGRAHGPPRS